ncbi:fibronectin type III domain-containing protein, partial [Candidatus Woesearchaeota archaeon]|nr:fibronectin type III domain-containing protein [Candidatus Woesearchaeota archaeon]
MKQEINQKICRIALFMMWLIVLMPIYSANALEIQFNPDAGLDVTDNSATIQWSTDEESTGKVRYGITDTGEFKSSSTPGTEHSIEITGISSETTFRFFIEAENDTATVRLPEEEDYFTFTTEPPRDRTPPHAVKNLAAPTVTRDMISLSWAPDDRDEDIDHYVVARDGEIISDTVPQPSFTNSGLNFSTEYIYVVSAVDTSGNTGPGMTLKVTTRSESYQPVFISNFKADVLGTNIYLTWGTNIESHTRVRYSTNPLLLDQKKEDAVQTTKHNITLIDLQPNTDYTLMAESCDPTGNCGNSSPITVRTTEKIELILIVDGMDCSLDTITYSNTNRFNVKGRSSPGADVNAYVNGKRQRFKRITSTGEFNFLGLDLDPNKAENEIRITASDQISPDKICIEKVSLDYFTPEVEFSDETENLSFSDQANARIRGSVFDEHKVTLYAYVQSVDDTTAPPVPENLSAQSMQANSITIQWDPFDVYVTDVSKYFIYRSDVPGGPIDSTEAGVTEYTDDKVSTSTTYTYQVSAVDKAGNEGQKSAPFSVTTLGNGTIVPPRTKITPPNPGLKLTKEYVTANTTIEFTESVGPLFDGQNIVRLEFVDEAGNAFERQFNIYYDREPPTFLSPTAADFQTLYSPSFVSEILVAGQINKPSGRILVWVNKPLSEDPTDTFEIGENGTFEAEISLITTIGAGITDIFEGDVGADIEVREEGGIVGPAS